MKVNVFTNNNDYGQWELPELIKALSNPVEYHKPEYSMNMVYDLHDLRFSVPGLLPTDEEVKEWFTINIDNDSASSAIYKFRLWLNDRLK